MKSQELAHEPEALKIDALPDVDPLINSSKALV